MALETRFSRSGREPRFSHLPQPPPPLRAGPPPHLAAEPTFSNQTKKEDCTLSTGSRPFRKVLCRRLPGFLLFFTGSTTALTRDEVVERLVPDAEGKGVGFRKTKTFSDCGFADHCWWTSVKPQQKLIRSPIYEHRATASVLRWL